MAKLGDMIWLLAAPLENHLWQSTLFGLAAACTTLLLRRNEARLRFWVWFLASAKFLLPFTLLMHTGAYLGVHFVRPSEKTFASVVEVVSQPFAPPASHLVLGPIWWGPLSAVLPLLIATLWVAGTLFVLSMWSLRWLRVFRTKRAATPLFFGVEADLLRSLKSITGNDALPILLSNTHVEPGVFGICRPVLLWPANITKELTEPQLRAILAHEAWHVRRQDNLTAAVQMFIEAIFWFHPLVWWFGSWQMEERERACDEGVLGLGSAPAVYAESILKTCKFCVEAPLPGVAGVNGPNLKKRITRIMQMQTTTTLCKAKKMLLGALTAAALATPVILGVVSTPNTGAQTNTSETASGPLRITSVTHNTSGSAMTQIKHTGDETSISNTTVRNLIQMAYSLKEYQLIGGPRWIDQDRFDLSFTGGSSSGPGQNMASNAAIKEILSQKFHLVLKRETKPGPVFALVLGSGGAKFSPTTPANAPGTDEPLLSMRVMQKDGQGQVSITGGPGGLADVLSSQVGRPVVDKTGLTGIYSISFHWATASASAESITADLQQQLGLALAPQEGPVETSVVYSISMPTGSL